MVYRILRQLLNNEKVIQQMADSRPMRQAARLFISGVYHVKDIIEPTRSNLLGSANKRVDRFLRNFREEYRKSIEQKK
jgi:hypothetical protein